MKHLFTSLCLVVLLGSGCPTGSLPNDFEPPQGKATTQDGQQRAQERAFEQRLVTAVSPDGITYTSTGTLISDQANSPELVVTADGTIYLYYTGWTVGDRVNTSAVAISQNGGKTWSYKYLELSGGGAIDRVLDPDVILLPDGKFRLFFTGGNPQGVHYAEGSDGIHFEYRAPIFTQQHDIAIGPTVQQIGDTWHLYARSQEGASRLWHLTSTDGITFTVYDLTSFPVEEVALLPSNGLWIEDRFHLFLSDQQGRIRSTWSKNGFDWYPQEGARLEPSPNESFVKEPAVAQLPNGSYLMVYVTDIP